MKALDRKLLRNFWQLKSQMLAIGLVMASGMSVYVMSSVTFTSLQWTQQTYYERYRFAEIFSHLRRAPNTLRARIEAIPGVRQVQTRVAQDVTLDLADLVEPAVGRLLGIPERERPGLNQLHLRWGRYIEPEGGREVLVHEAFAEEHHLLPGSELIAILNGRKERLKVVGIFLSPEFIYAIRPGDLLPDNRRFGVLWMGEKELAAAFNMEDAFNDVTLSLMPGAIPQQVMQHLDRELAPYGGTGATTRDDQSSHKILSGELRQLRSMSLVFPSIALAVSGFLLHVVLSRLIATQREEIAALKAFGYTRFELGVHYFKFVIVLLVFGVAAGAVTGILLARDLTHLYVRFFRFPVFLFRVDPLTILSVLLLGSAASGLGAWEAVRRAVRLPPAEAMRPEPPGAYRPSLFERIGLQRLLTPASRMILRYIERQPIRSLVTSLGIALAIAVLILGSYIEDSVNYAIDFQFHLAQRNDVTIGFVDPLEMAALTEARQLPGVTYAQPFRSVPARLRSGYRSRRIAIMGLSRPRPLFRVIDASEQEVELPENGIVLSSKAAEILHVEIGDRVTLEILEGRRSVRETIVTGLFRDFSEPGAYMDLALLQRLVREGEQISGAFLSVDSRQVEALHKQLKQTPKVASVSVKAAILDSFRKTFAENLLRMRFYSVLFATIMAFGVVYNSARISLSERSRDLATLRVMGFTRAEISRILLGELAVLAIAAVPLGLAIGYALSAFSIWALETETQRFPLVIHPATYAFAVTVVIVAAALSALVVHRLLSQLNLVAVLKAKE